MVEETAWKNLVRESINQKGRQCLSDEKQVQKNVETAIDRVDETISKSSTSSSQDKLIRETIESDSESVSGSGFPA